jgi:hypothetical protein
MRAIALLSLSLAGQLAGALPANTATAGGPAWCTPDTVGNGPALYQRSKDCCAAGGGPHARFNDVDGLCEGIFGAFAAPLPSLLTSLHSLHALRLFRPFPPSVFPPVQIPPNRTGAPRLLPLFPSHAGALDNGVDWGQFARCCDARGGGSGGCPPNSMPFRCKPNGRVKANSS